MEHAKKEIAQNLPHLNRFALHLTNDRTQANDLVQDCVVRALEKDHLFRTGSDRRKWLFALMRNIFVDGKRRDQTRSRYADDVRESYHLSQPAHQYDRQFLRETLAAVDNLNGSERQAIRLLCLEGKSLAEVSKQKGVPIGTLKSRLSRGRSKLRNLMRDDGVELRKAA